jgi:uncharacterized protein (TIGR02996 family)
MKVEDQGFLDAIFKDPDDNSLRLIYADWLEERGCYHGELIRVHLALLDASRSDRTELQNLATVLENRHLDTVFAATPKLRELLHREPARITWDRGFIRSIDLEGTAITKLPNDLKVAGNLYLAGTRITALPPNLNVGGSLYLAYTPITALPDNLGVGGNLDLAYTRITALPMNLRVGENFDLESTRITEATARQVLEMPGLSDQAKVTGLSTARFETLATQARRRAEQNRNEGRA